MIYMDSKWYVQCNIGMILKSLVEVKSVINDI